MLRTDQTKERRTVFFCNLGGVSNIYFIIFVPNLLRKAVKVEGTQEGTSHGPKTHDVGCFKKVVLQDIVPYFHISKPSYSTFVTGTVVRVMVLILLT